MAVYNHNKIIQKTIMCIFLYNFSFSLHYECQFGEFLALIGSIEELGGWDISKAIELVWAEVFIFNCEQTFNKCH